jgi:16S rRNA (guanine527-N7)-methyltransferase
VKSDRAGENRHAAGCAAVEDGSGSRGAGGAACAGMSSRREPLPPRFLSERAPLPLSASGLSALPDVFHETLRNGLAALRLEPSGEQLDAIAAYIQLLLAWTQAINLTAIREPQAVARDHVIDSLSAVPLLREAGARTILDLGSGGGLPGIPLAIVLPELRVLLVESIGKKASFLATAVRALGIADRVTVAAERAESLAMAGRERERFDAVTVRAVASLSELVELAFPLLRLGGRLVAWKRGPLGAELVAGRNAARAVGGELEVVPVTAPGLTDHCLVVATKMHPTPRRFPRSPAERRAKPL